MAVLRSGKVTKSRAKIKKSRNGIIQKYNLKECSIKVQKLSQHEINSFLQPKKYNLRDRAEKITVQSTSQPVEKGLQSVHTTSLKKVATSQVIWHQLTNRQYEFHPTEIVLAKMNKYRPWPAKINSVYKVGNVIKCCVLFFGTFQLGSVLKSDCVKIGDCDLYLLHAVREIKEKYNWNLNYDKITKTEETERVLALSKLTQVQTFLLSIRDVEHIQKVPYDRSLIQNA